MSYVRCSMRTVLGTRRIMFDEKTCKSANVQLCNTQGEGVHEKLDVEFLDTAALPRNLTGIQS